MYLVFERILYRHHCANDWCISYYSLIDTASACGEVIGLTGLLCLGTKSPSQVYLLSENKQRRNTNEHMQWATQLGNKTGRRKTFLTHVPKYFLSSG